MINKFFKILSSPITMAVLLLLSAFFMGLATFIENDFGAAAAKRAVYNAWWFEALLLLLALNFTGAIFTRKLYKRNKWPVFVFHVAFIIILLGAGVTRHIGYEGIMHIREGESSNKILMQEKALKIRVNDQKSYTYFLDYDNVHEKSFSDDVNINGVNYEIELSTTLNAAAEKAIESEDGVPTIGFILAGRTFRGFTYIQKGEVKQLGDLRISFLDSISDSDINFSMQQDSFYMESNVVMTMSDMDNNKESSFVKGKQPLGTGKLYQAKRTNLVVKETFNSANIGTTPVNSKTNQNSIPALVFNIKTDNEEQQIAVQESQEFQNKETSVKFGNTVLHFAYGYNVIELPFEIYLKDFEIERYPGSMSPSSFSSHVTVYQEGQEPHPYHIYMNNILQMGGYRFYQSSYDKDEKGTVLSVNHDGLGTTITYVGYFFLILGLLWSIVSKGSYMKNTRKKLNNAASAILLFIFVGLASTLSGQNAPHQHQHAPQHFPHEKPPKVIDAKHANKFGKMLVQDYQGRTKPINTLASDLLRKVARKSNIEGISPIQFYLELHINPENWVNVPFIKVGNDGLQKQIGIKGDYATYSELVVPGRGYILSGMAEKVYAKSPAQRSKLDKELLKVDERVNIAYGIISGSFLSIFPTSDTTLHKWQTPDEAYKHVYDKEDSAFVKNVIPVYFETLKQAKKTNDYSKADEILEGIIKYQRNNNRYELPSDTHVALELAYYKFDIYKKLFPYYATVGLLFLIVLVISIIRGIKLNKWVNRSFISLIALGFALHTMGLIVRWYISGHAPMSNGYESMIFVSWVTLLAGFIFRKFADLALSATAILGGFTLMVANLSFMDPQITNLVPVLKSYWLTLHVSVITGSYGFLGLGAILGIINQILFIVKTRKNEARITESIMNLTAINHKSLILGIVFLTIGTFLGAVWANESWGRYWGWDPKETWSLITIIIYTIVTHARIVPGMKGIFTFNILSVYAFFSVLMTYFGVNYYLSGLHSYAGGDPVPVPTFVYVSVAVLILLTATAWTNQRNVKK
jgi:cytochrome c-type biogenesis protein CcsB